MIKKFNLIIFHEGSVYRASNICRDTSIDTFNQLYSSLCDINDIPYNEAEILWFDFDFFDSDVESFGLITGGDV